MQIHVEVGNNLAEIALQQIKASQGNQPLDIATLVEAAVKPPFEDLREKFQANLEEAFPLGGEEIPKYQAMKAFEDAINSIKK